MGVGFATPATLYVGGYVSTRVTNVEEWNGSAWTEVNDLNQGRLSGGGAGTSTAGLVFGGELATGKTEKYDGTSWTEVNDMNTARFFNAGSGSQTEALTFGGGPPFDLANTESWNGTSWTEVNDLSNAARPSAPKNSAKSTVAMGGGPPAESQSEEWEVPGALKTLASTNA
jgi:hypothetical protein